MFFDMRLEHEVIQSHKLWLCIIFVKNRRAVISHYYYSFILLLVIRLKITFTIITILLFTYLPFSYHLYPQFLHLILFRTSELNNPNIAPPNIFFPTKIFLILGEPHVGHLGVLSLLLNNYINL